MLRRALMTVCLALGCAALPAVASAATQTVVPYSSGGWKYQAGSVAGFEQPAFDDSGWATGAMPFGALTTCATPGVTPPTTDGGWTNNSDLMLRKTFTLPPGATTGSVSVRVDNDVAVNVNGTALTTADHEGCATVGPPGPIAIPAAALHAGQNVIALRAIDRADQRYIDARVQVEIPDGFTAAVTPGSVTAGTTATFQAAITNWSSSATLDSVTLDPPDGLGDPVVLSGLGLAPGASTTRTFSASAGCGPGGGAWGATAGALPLLGGAGATAVTGTCSVAFGTAPAAARTGQTISGTAFTPGGPPLTVAVLAGNGSPVADGTPVTVAIAPDPSGTGALHGTTTRTTAGGSATFGDLSIDAPGGYRLAASAPGVGTATSDAFPIEDATTVCTGATCTASVSSPATSVQGTATSSGGPSFLSLSLNVGPELKCAGYNAFSPDWVSVNGSANLTQKLITFKIGYRTLFTGWQLNGLSRVQACFSAPYSFATRAGFPAAATTQFDGDGDGVDETWRTGILPECRVLLATKPPPCVSDRQLLRDGVAITVKMPGGSIDPRMRG